jgi:Ala-tRNA(Pro) deacylase
MYSKVKKNQRYETNNKTYDTYETLKNFFSRYGVTYREVEHALEGRSDRIAEIRGNKKEQAAKAMVIDVTVQQDHKYYLTVLPGSNKVNLELIRTFLKADKVSFAKTKVMKRLTNCDSGAVPPFSFNKDLNVIVDPELYKNEEIVFNAGRLDRSMYISSKDYRRILGSEYQENQILIELSISHVESNFFRDSDPQQSQDKLESKILISNKE